MLNVFTLPPELRVLRDYCLQKTLEAVSALQEVSRLRDGKLVSPDIQEGEAPDGQSPQTIELRLAIWRSEAAGRAAEEAYGLYQKAWVPYHVGLLAERGSGSSAQDNEASPPPANASLEHDQRPSALLA